MNQDTIEAAASAASAVSISKGATYGGAAVAFVSAFPTNQIIARGGLAGGALGMLVNWYYQFKRDRREEAQAALRMRK